MATAGGVTLGLDEPFFAAGAAFRVTASESHPVTVTLPMERG